ncbi:NAD-dependent protein deacylase [Salibacterium halotolerans]|uniref:NAD-dependent protein deacetylase n=1 Tax=Salibacterium halotolerans TaxID=1884432 RepID=A0A1I5RQA0_9BACI|nr:NAD-dependent protein deacylase [Salibacterium halotolerans]SFP60722.1 NAD-dependent deacetylase [Salibacterium halotolerans]
MSDLSDILKESNHTVVMTGAGMSTESGLPDFRSSTGLWKNRDPAALASVDAMEHHRGDFFEFYRSRIEALHGVEPNAGHRILAKWEEQSIVQSVITQNVDGLHQQAGSRNTAELHGSIAGLRCHSCGHETENSRYLEHDTTCPVCGGFLRPSIVLFGEMLPEQAIATAQQEAARADLFLVLGTSLTVAPASHFPAEAKQQGARLAIVNQTPTDMDDEADLLIQGENISTVLSEADACLQDGP